ncbi:MAG: hypothetical protein AB8U44_03915 [Aaplasma endosymbiont of Hyalomma asiaticum]
MFSIGLSEILLVVVVGCLVTDPKKLPSVVSTCRAYYKKFDEVRAEIFASFRDICEVDGTESEDLTSISRGEKRIVGDDGKIYEAYDIGNLVKLDNRNRESVTSGSCTNASSDQGISTVVDPTLGKNRDNK